MSKQKVAFRIEEGERELLKEKSGPKRGHQPKECRYSHQQKYFGGLCEGHKGIEALEELVKVYINGDGAGWIKSGTDYIEKSRFVLDKFHMHKYIMGNWAGIMQWVKDKNKEVRCSAEGHISHVYASRMSSRPLGWSREGVDKMSRLRIYHANGGDMLELVRYQKKALPVAAGCEEVIYSCSTVIASERRNRNALGRFADLPSYSIPYTQVKKIAALKNHIWGL